MRQAIVVATTSASAKVAHTLATAGISVIPILPTGQKKPRIAWKEFQSRIMTPDEIDRLFLPGDGIAIVGGAVSGKLGILDIEYIAPFEELADRVNVHLPGLLETLPHVGTPKGGHHFFFRCEAIGRNQKLATKLGEGGTPVTMIETRAEGGYVVTVPSPAACHELNKEYVKLSGPSLTAIPTITAEQLGILLSCCRSLNEYVKPDQLLTFVAAPGAHSGTRSGDDYNARGDAMGVLMAAGWTVEHTKGETVYLRRPGKSTGMSASFGHVAPNVLYVFSTNAAPFDFERAYDAFGIYMRLMHGGDIQAATRELGKLGFGSQNRMATTRRHNEMNNKEMDALYDPVDWPAPEPIMSGLPPVEAFDETLLPEAFRGFVVDVAERMQVPMDYPAAVVVLCLAGVVSRRARVQPKALDSGWIVVPNLWGGIVAPPGFMKSPVIQGVTGPLNQLQAEWRTFHEQANSEYQRELEESGLRRSAWREQFKANAKNGKAAPIRTDDEPTAPTLRRLIVNDATFEALHQTMSENPAGILVVRDELTGWWTQLDRAGREGERAFCLQAWNGDTGHTIDRIGRGTVHVPACCMSMIGGIQPGRLRSYLTDALLDGPSNDGLIQRFQVMVWPDTRVDWRYVDRPPEAAAIDKAGRIFRRLVELDAEDPVRYRFAPDSQELFVAWLAELEKKIRGDELHPALVHLSKYRKLMPALAVLFELADWAAGTGGTDTVSLEHARRAAAFCDYLESHARRVYSCVVTPQLRAAQDLAGKIKGRKIGADGFFSCRDVYLKGWSGLDTPESVQRAATVLKDYGWLRDLPNEAGPQGGRPSNRYAVNPGVCE